jgi:hypothetical protein
LTEAQLEVMTMNGGQKTYKYKDEPDRRLSNTTNKIEGLFKKTAEHNVSQSHAKHKYTQNAG